MTREEKLKNLSEFLKGVDKHVAVSETHLVFQNGLAWHYLNKGLCKKEVLLLINIRLRDGK